jgi:hypothetical protein
MAVAGGLAKRCGLGLRTCVSSNPCASLYVPVCARGCAFVRLLLLHLSLHVCVHVYECVCVCVCVCVRVREQPCNLTDRSARWYGTATHPRPLASTRWAWPLRATRPSVACRCL